MADPQQISIPPGLLVLTTYGQITAETTKAWSELRSFNEAQGLKNINYDLIPGTLVEKARNEACRRSLTMGAGWVCMIDADMTFTPDSLFRILQTAYGTHPFLDVVGAYCNLRGDVGLPTIDTGTGTWEVHYPGSGVLEVIRTGGAYILVKRHVLERLPDPWFRMRVPSRPIDALGELDNFARCKMDGQNPFRGLAGQPWERLEEIARVDPSANGQWTPAEVGEDSGFCDRAKLYGFRIGVDTNVACGHVDRKITDHTTLKAHVEKMERQALLCAGFMS